MPSQHLDVIVVSSSSSNSRSSSPLPEIIDLKMNTRQAEVVEDEDMNRSSAASRVSLANLLGPSGPGSSPYANSSRTSPRKRSSAGESSSNLQLPPPENANANANGNGSGSSSNGERRRADLSSPQLAPSAEPAQTFHDAEEHVADDVLMADAIEGNAQDPEDDEDDDDEDDDEDDDDKGTTDAGSGSEGEGEDKGEGTSSKDGPSQARALLHPRNARVVAARLRRSGGTSCSEATYSADQHSRSQADRYLIKVPELVVAKLKKESHPWAKWYEEQLLDTAEPEPVAPSGPAAVPPGLEGFGGLAKLLAKYPSGEGGPSGAGGAAKKRRRPNDDKYDIGQYDVRDPFVDDSELDVDEPTTLPSPKPTASTSRKALSSWPRPKP